MTNESTKTAANDIGREGLATPIMLIGLWERVARLVTDIVLHKLD